jgi:hypothetical protein
MFRNLRQNFSHKSFFPVEVPPGTQMFHGLFFEGKKKQIKRGNQVHLSWYRMGGIIEQPGLKRFSTKYSKERPLKKEEDSLNQSKNNNLMATIKLLTYPFNLIQGDCQKELNWLPFRLDDSEQSDHFIPTIDCATFNMKPQKYEFFLRKKAGVHP